MSLELVCLHEDIHGVHDLLSLEYSQRRHCPSRLVQTPVRIPAKCFWFQMWNVELGTVIRIRPALCVQSGTMKKIVGGLVLLLVTGSLVVYQINLRSEVSDAREKLKALESKNKALIKDMRGAAHF